MKHAGIGALVTLCVAIVASQPGRAGQTEPSLPMSFAGMTLGQAEEAGIAASPDVAAARARVAGARAALAAARWGVAPSGFASFNESPQGGVGPNTVSAHQTTVGVQADLVCGGLLMADR